MKDYLLKFRDQAFGASWLLFKNIFPSSFLAMIIIGILLFIVITPLSLMMMGYGATEFLTYQQDMLDLQQKMQESGDFSQMMEIYQDRFIQMNIALFVIVILLALVIYSWASSFLFNISDNEIRNGKTMIFNALSRSFSKIPTMILLFILYFLIQLATYIVFFGLIFVGGLVHPILAGLLGFVGFFFVLAFLLRFSISIPAVLHGNMSANQAISFSYNKITWRRGFMLLLMCLLVMVLLILVALLLSGLLINNSNTITTENYLMSQIVSLLISAVFTTYLISALSTLYFRYSDDSIGDEEHEHFVGEFDKD